MGFCFCIWGNSLWLSCIMSKMRNWLFSDYSNSYIHPISNSINASAGSSTLFFRYSTIHEAHKTHIFDLISQSISIPNTIPRKHSSPKRDEETLTHGGIVTNLNRCYVTQPSKTSEILCTTSKITHDNWI